MTSSSSASPLLEFSATRPLNATTTFELAFSGDALNAAVAAAAAGARAGLLTRLGRDELSDRLVTCLDERGVDTSLVRRAEGQTGAYVLGADPMGTREFAYLRAGSAATRLEPSDVDFETKVLLISGITAALSPSGQTGPWSAIAVLFRGCPWYPSNPLLTQRERETASRAR